jgi:hypothetical protein
MCQWTYRTSLTFVASTASRIGDRSTPAVPFAAANFGWLAAHMSRWMDGLDSMLEPATSFE